MIDPNLKLYLPFDDADGSVAADFSPSRNDATLSGGAALTKEAFIGKALSLGGGTAECGYDIPYSSNFSILFFVCPQTDKIGWILNFSGVDNYLENWYSVQPGTWHSFAFVRSGSKFTVFKDSRAVEVYTIGSNPVGFSFNEPGLFESRSLLDEMRIYNRALTASEVLKLQSSTDVEYYINGHNFKEFGIYVSGSAGLVGQLAKKDGLTVDWDTYHGKVRDKKNPRFKERTISLECFVEAKSRTDFVNKVMSFFEQFDGSGTQRLKVEYDGTARPLVYEVYQPQAVDPSKEWGHYNRQLMVGTFKLVLEEDDPVKRVLRHVSSQANSTVTINVTSNKLLNIYWGDGTHTYGVSGTDRTVTHNYAEAGEYDIIVAGVIEDITAFDTSAIIIWNKLK